MFFANDILKEARTAWVHYFAKYGYTPDVYREEKYCGSRETAQGWGMVFPEKVDVSAGGFPSVRISVWRGSNGFNSQKRSQRKKIIDGEMPPEETRGKIIYMDERSY